MAWDLACKQIVKRRRRSTSRSGCSVLIHCSKSEKIQALHRPVISVDTKKKELVGDFKNTGWEWHRKGESPEVNTHDFPDPKLGKVIPYGIYDLSFNKGWVNVGIDHDTAEFAVESIRRWWYGMGRAIYPRSKHLLITADCGGSNGNRNKLWKLKLQQLANETGLTIDVCHSGTSKWNKIEHRLFCHISENWRGRPLTTRQVVVNLIGHTTTDQGLEVQAMLDENCYPIGIEVSDKQLKEITLKRYRFHGEWNYQISMSKNT